MGVHPFTFPCATERMDRETAQREARRYALHVGGAGIALAGIHVTQADEFVWALRGLDQMERGVEVSDLERICANPAGVHPDWTARLHEARANRAAWLAELNPMLEAA